MPAQHLHPRTAPGWGLPGQAAKPQTTILPLFLSPSGCLSDKKLSNTSSQEDLCSAARGIDAMRHRHLFLAQDRAKQRKPNQIKAKLQSSCVLFPRWDFFSAGNNPKSWRRGMLCSPTPLSRRLVPGEPAPSLAAGEAILQAVWPELRVRGCGFNPLPTLNRQSFFQVCLYCLLGRILVTPAGSRMHCSILGFVGFILAEIKPPWSEAHHLKMWPVTHFCGSSIVLKPFSSSSGFSGWPAGPLKSVPNDSPLGMGQTKADGCPTS